MPWIAVAALAAVAWAVTVMLARTMGNGPGTMGLALLPFLGLWVVMMAAMMLPSVAPVAVLWTRLIAGAPAGPGRPLRMGAFLAVRFPAAVLSEPNPRARSRNRAVRV